jgi:hypothetical protein
MMVCEIALAADDSMQSNRFHGDRWICIPTVVGNATTAAIQPSRDFAEIVRQDVQEP